GSSTPALTPEASVASGPERGTLGPKTAAWGAESAPGGAGGKRVATDRPAVGGDFLHRHPHALRLAAGGLHIRVGQLTDQFGLLLGGLAGGLLHVDERHGVLRDGGSIHDVRFRAAGPGPL